MLRRLLSAAAVTLLLPAAAFALVPDAILVQIPDGNGVLRSTEDAGTLESGDFTCSWSFSDGAAVVDCAGSFTSLNYSSPSVVFSWLDLAVPLPVHGTVTSVGSGEFSYAGAYLDPDLNWVTPLLALGHVGGLEFGQEFGATEEVRFEFALDSFGVVYDLHIALEWGPGVPETGATWGGVRALYR